MVQQKLMRLKNCVEWIDKNENFEIFMTPSMNNYF